jgi:16S rRNA (cytidine1402-2'-O)-methyltransferase
MKNLKSGNLYIVATPIGNPQDITLRAIEMLRLANAVVCEELRLGTTLLKKLNIVDKEILTLNEHNEDEQTGELMIRLHTGQSLALISDCGTPTFADPGARLIEEAIQQRVPVIPVPGPSSLMSALSVSPVPLKEFIFAGFLPRKDPERISKLKNLQGIHMPLVLMDTPYRLGKLLQEVENVFGKNRQVTLAVDLTLPNELILHGPLTEVRQRIQARKGEFILIVYR